MLPTGDARAIDAPRERSAGSGQPFATSVSGYVGSMPTLNRASRGRQLVRGAGCGIFWLLSGSTAGAGLLIFQHRGFDGAAVSSISMAGSDRTSD